MTDKYRVGILGCGGMSRNHLRGYINCGRYEIVALADLQCHDLARDVGDCQLGCGLHLDLTWRRSGERS